jgi:hypothetical protein
MFLFIWEITNRRITVQAGQGKKQDPISKNKTKQTRSKRAGGTAQVVELLPSKHESLLK